MDDANSLERIYSFNIAQGNPVAESTHLNGTSFSWGSSMSPQHRSYSNLYLCDTQTASNFNHGSIRSSKNLTKIDARIAADIQSKGLASRIVKYHESGTRLNRSMSAHNLYSKPGQFPAVTLKKTELPYRAAKQELSMIRIPPPEKSSFYGNTISSLLRSSSVMGLQSKRNEDLSRENRPIIHPPPTEDDMAPTRSVLDVLKEISRKRINSDNLESAETSKKYCNRAGNDFVDTNQNKMSAIQPNFIASTLSCQRYKRQRDCITPLNDVQLPETQVSPEQAKKRVCNYNNDITSSLSSSIKFNKMSASHNLNQTLPTNLESYETEKSNAQCYRDSHKKKNNTRVDIRSENVENNLRKVDTINPISPIPGKHCALEQNSDDGITTKRTISESFCSSDQKMKKKLREPDYKPYITMSNKKCDESEKPGTNESCDLVPEPFYSSDHKIQKKSPEPAYKPRITLFNKKCDESEKAGTNESCDLVPENIDSSNVLNDCASIPFVKPKKITSKSGLRNPLMERTQKSKLALMLSGLRGELYINSDVNESDSSFDKEKLQPTKDNRENINATAISAVKSTSSSTLTTVTSSSNIEISNSSNLFSLSTKTLSLPSSSSATKTSPLVGLKVSPSNSSPKNISHMFCVDATKSTETQSKPNIPVLGGFPFSTTNSTLVLNTSSSNIAKDSKITTTPISSALASNNNILNFGESTASLTIDDKSNKLPVNMIPSAASTINTSTSSNTTSSLAVSKNLAFGSNLTEPPSSRNTSPSAAVSVPLDTAAKPNTVFGFTVPSTSFPTTTTSAGQIIFGNSCSATSSTKTTSTGIAAATTNALTFSAVATSENLSGSTNKPSFTFNTNKKTSSNVPTTTSSTANLTADSITTFGTNSYSTTKMQPTSSCFTFTSDTKSPNFVGGQTNQEVAIQTGNNAFNSNTSKLFDSQCFNTNTTGESAAVFGNVTNSLENVFNSSSTTPDFGINSIKTGTQTFGLTANNKRAVLGTPTVFGNNRNNSSTSSLFSFGSKPATSTTMSTNNVSAAPGGFSFSSAASHNAESITFGSNGQTNTLNNTFSGTSASDSQNSFKFGSSANKSGNSASIFGVAVNKQAESITSPGGFSFGSASPLKTTFTFGAGNNLSGNTAASSNNPLTGFTFGAPAATKINEFSSNKTFSFGSPQTTQQKETQSVPNSNGSALNIFGLSDVTKHTQSTAFNFNTGSSQNLQSNTPAINNMFAPTASSITTGPGDRPIRRATRRLQK